MLGENLNDEFGLDFWISSGTGDKPKSKEKPIDIKTVTNDIISLCDEELEG